MLPVTKKHISRVCFFLFLLLSLSCHKKESPSTLEKENNLKKVYFSFNDFYKEISLFESAVTTKSEINNSIPELNRERAELLGYWDFNNKSFNPTYIADKGVGGRFHPTSQNFVDFKYNINTIDKSENYMPFIKELKSIIIEIDYNYISKVEKIELDFAAGIKSPEGFLVEFHYDGTVNKKQSMTFQLKKESIPMKRAEKFEINIPKEIKPQRNLFVIIEFDNISIGKDLLDLKNRWLNAIDNIRVYGFRKNINPPIKNQMPYFIFNKTKGGLVESGNFMPTTMNKNLFLELPVGTYYKVILYHESENNIVIPSVIKSKEDFYLSSFFNDRNSRTFGVLDSFELQESSKMDVKLKRMYSLVTLDFTDIRDLKNIKKVVVKPLSPNIIWQPFNSNVKPNLAKNMNKEIEFTQDFNVFKEISFNHFLGLPSHELSLNYEIEVYDKEKVIRKFRLNASIMNNIKLVFKGSLYPVGIADQLFEIFIDQEWDGTKLIEFK